MVNYKKQGTISYIFPGNRNGVKIIPTQTSTKFMIVVVPGKGHYGDKEYIEGFYLILNSLF